MASPLDLTVVIPAFNEAGRIAATLEQLRAYLSSRSWEWEIVVVDDGSGDRTAYAAERAGKLGNRFGCVTPDEAVVSHEVFAAALESQRGHAVVEI